MSLQALGIHARVAQPARHRLRDLRRRAVLGGIRDDHSHAPRMPPRAQRAIGPAPQTRGGELPAQAEPGAVAASRITAAAQTSVARRRCLALVLRYRQSPAERDLTEEIVGASVRVTHGHPLRGGCE